MANDLMERMSDQPVASFVARSVTVEKGATERLAHALEVLVPEAERKGRILELAHDEARQSEAGEQEGFEQLWHSAADMLTSYSDASFVSEEYGKELTAARAQALEVERVPDDPPERVHAWLGPLSSRGAGRGARVRRSAGTRARLGRHGLRIRAAGSGSRSAARSASHRRGPGALGRYGDDRAHAHT